jgi:hypothetical protein
MPPKPKGPLFTCFFCGAKLSEEKLTRRIREVEEDPALYSVIKERYGEVFNIDEKAENG